MHTLLSIVADDVWLWFHLRDRQGRGLNIEKTNTVRSQSLPKGRGMHWYGRTSRWAPPKCHKWMSCWTSPMNKCRATGHSTYVTTHSPTLPSLYLRHSSFSNPSVASPMSQFILQPFFRFSYVTSCSLNSPGEPPTGLETSRAQEYKHWSHGMTNVSIPEVNMLNNSSAFAISVPISLYFKFGFVSVNGTRETYFVDVPRNTTL